MNQREKQVPANGLLILVLVLISTIAVTEGFTGNGKYYWVLIISLPVLLLAILNNRQPKQQRKKQKQPVESRLN